MQVITAEQRNSTNPIIREWVIAKDAQNAAEAAAAAQGASPAQAAAAAAAQEAAQIAAWKATIPSTPTVVQQVVNTVKTVAQNVAGVIVGPTSSQGSSGGNSGGGVVVAPTSANGYQQTQNTQNTVTKVLQGPFIQPDGSVVAGQTVTVQSNQAAQQTSAGANSVTPVMTGAVSQANAAIVGGIDSRRAELQAFTGWDNDANIRSIQQKSWDIYIATGRWDSAEQVQLHDKAEAARKAINLAYQGALWGTPDKAAADALILPTNQFPTTNGIENGLTNLLSGGANGAIGNGIGLLLSGGLLLLIFSAFKKH